MIKKSILLIGGSGNLGSKILNSNFFKKIYSPKKKELDLLNRNSISKTIKKKKFEIIINCAALARIKDCEKSPSQAIKINIYGTSNLVKEILNYNSKNKNKIKLIHISTDAVYNSIKGNYREDSPLKPYNVYGWTKVASEFFVKLVNNHVIVRTRFFDKKTLKYKYSAKDIYTSQIEVNTLVKYLYYLVKSNFIGVINVGGKKISDYKMYKKYLPKLKPFSRKELIKKLNINLAKDSSLNIKKFEKIKKKYE